MAQSTETLMNMSIVAPQAWQMSYGERAAFEGLLAQIKPNLAIEIGTAQGGSLKRIVAHSAEVHSFDLVAPPADVACLDNVTFHTGDSHDLLGAFLREASDAGRQIDFVLIDGDHTADGVRRDIVDVLSCDAVQRAVIVLHDTLNPEVRSGIEAAAIGDHPKVALYEPDLVPGYLARREPYRLQMWGGLGLIVVDAAAREERPDAVRDDRFHELFAVLRPTVDAMCRIESRGATLDRLNPEDVETAIRREISANRVNDSLRDERDYLRDRLSAIEGSRGWRLVRVWRELRDLVTRRR